MTFREKLEKNHLDDDIYDLMRRSCPQNLGYELSRGCPRAFDGSILTCDDCWNREIPEDITHDIYVPLSKDDKTKLCELITKAYEEKENNYMKKTKAMLEEELKQKTTEIEDLKKELDAVEKYKQYDDAAGELKAAYDSFVNAGFNEEQAFTLLTLVIQNQIGNNSRNYTYRPYKR